jgi:hypothetical protein
LSLLYESNVNVQAFSTTFTFVPNGFNFAFVVENTSNTDFNRGGFSAGASQEGGFSQFANSVPYATAPNNVFALQKDGQGINCQTCSYTNGGVQWYQSLQNPALAAEVPSGACLNTLAM